jgi:hypothetical protein
VGYFFDSHATIRVIYKSLDPNIGRKPMYHLDRHGEPVLYASSSTTCASVAKTIILTIFDEDAQWHYQNSGLIISKLGKAAA